MFLTPLLNVFYICAVPLNFHLLDVRMKRLYSCLVLWATTLWMRE